MSVKAVSILNRLPVPEHATSPRTEFRAVLLGVLADIDFEALRTLCAFFNCSIEGLTTRVMDYLYDQARQRLALERKKARAAKEAATGRAAEPNSSSSASCASGAVLPSAPLDPGVRCSACGRAFPLCLALSKLRSGRSVCPVAKMRQAVRAAIEARGIALAQAHLCWDCYNDVLEGVSS
jgi:hypothetical protein